MAVIKRIVILANSVKNSGRCLAGKELCFNQGKWEVGSWVRIVGAADGSEVSLSWMLEQFGREPKLLDVIDIPLDSAVPLPDQPENWLMVRHAKWRDRGTSTGDISNLVDHPLKLWGTHQRSVPQGIVPNMAEPASLYFIRPEAVGPIKVWTEDKVDGTGSHFDRHRREISLKYRGLFHDFTATDPAIQELYYPRLPARGEPMLKIDIANGRLVYVCVSLTPPWHGRHYKIAAGFIQTEN